LSPEATALVSVVALFRTVALAFAAVEGDFLRGCGIVVSAACWSGSLAWARGRAGLRWGRDGFSSAAGPGSVGDALAGALAAPAAPRGRGVLVRGLDGFLSAAGVTASLPGSVVSSLTAPASGEDGQGAWSIPQWP